MTVLLPVYEFEFQEFEDSTPLKGFYRDLNSKELKELDKKNKAFNDIVKQGTDLERKLKRVIEKIDTATRKEDWEAKDKLQDEKYALEDELLALADKTNPDDKGNDVIKWKMNICLTGEDKDKIIALAESYGYQKVQKIIFEAIQEKKQNA